MRFRVFCLRRICAVLCLLGFCYLLSITWSTIGDRQHSFAEIDQYLRKRYYQRLEHVSDPRELASDDTSLSDVDLETYYYNYVDHVNQADKVVKFCNANNIRFGGEGEGSWLICKLQLSANCLVYSFGIGYDWRFEDEITRTFGCRLRAFDPSIQLNDHNRSLQIAFYKAGLSGDNSGSVAANWQMASLQQHRVRFNEGFKPIDVLKVDVELSEWSALHVALQDGSLRSVLQLVIEVHTDELFGAMTGRMNLFFYLDLLFALSEAGFVKWRSETNFEGVHYHSRRTHRQRPCCAQLYFVNRNYTGLL